MDNLNKKVIKILLVVAFLLANVGTLEMKAQPQQQERCAATTKQGTRCKNKAVNNTKYCQVHKAKFPSVQQCKAKTKSGTRGSREAKISGYCK